MSTAHVVVIDSTARRAMVKTTPSKHLSDILEEACKKLGVTASKYGLKHNDKDVELSRTFRLSGLSSGAKLELVQLSKSAGVVSVALKLPPEETESTTDGRITDKFPSDTTLWQVLRRFEEGVAGGSSRRNITQRGASSTGAGAGRLFYQQPVLNLEGRELASLADLNKNLAQLGYNKGSVLVRLSFRTSDTSLEEAATQIAQYFMSVDQENSPPTTVATPNVPKEEHIPSPGPEEPEWMQDNEPEPVSVPTPETTEPSTSEAYPQSNATDAEPTNSSSRSRPLSVYRPPSSTTPLAALTSHNEADYTPTVEHAHSHQKMLNDSSRNKRLPTEAEIAAAAEAESEKLAAIKDVEIRIRFPDQSQVDGRFTQVDTGSSLYTEVRTRMLESRYSSEPFVLRDPSVRNKGDILMIPDNGKKLIQQLGLKARVLLVFSWSDSASPAARGAGSVVRKELRDRAVDLTVNDVSTSVTTDNDRGMKVNIGNQEEDKKDEGGGIGKKMPKWLKGLGKK